MRDNALYFPYISVPNDAWTSSALLYWDRLFSIVPMDHIEEPEQLSSFMRDLVRERLVEQVFPSQYLYMIPEFSVRFEELIRARARRTERFRPASIPSEPRARIHMEKMGDIPAMLTELGLATALDRRWDAVDENIANLFMAYLAACLGALPEVNAAPVTHQAKYLAVFGNSDRQYSRVNPIHREKARQVMLHALLPRPDEPVSLSKLVQFKERHGHLLPAFRREVEAHCSRIASLTDPLERLAMTGAFISNSKQQVEEIVGAMKPTWKRIAFGSLTPLFGAGLTLHATDTGNIVAYAGTALSFAGAAYQAIASIRGNREELMRRPLAYVAHARGLT